jgi:hypothetical protein
MTTKRVSDFVSTNRFPVHRSREYRQVTDAMFEGEASNIRICVIDG